MATSKYIPGVCNIGPGQVQVRRVFGMVGALTAIVTWDLLIRVGASPAWYWLLTVPTAAAALGFLQAASRFCADFGLRGVFNMDPAVTGSDSPVQAKYRAQDRRKAIGLLFYSVVIGSLVAAAAFALAA